MVGVEVGAEVEVEVGVEVEVVGWIVGWIGVVVVGGVGVEIEVVVGIEVVVEVKERQGRIMTECPYCRRPFCVPGQVYSNVENYGSSIFHVLCKHCKKMIEVVASRNVLINEITKSNKKPSERDF